MDFWLILFIFDWMLFVIIAGTVLYLGVFAVAALFHSKPDIPKAKKFNRFVILIPAYKQDNVIEQTVLAFTQIRHITIGHDGCNYHLVTVYLVHAVAVQDVHAAQRGCGGVRSHIGHLDTEFAAALIDIEFTCLEYCLALRIIEVTERYKVAQEGVEVTIQVQQFCYLIDGE